MLKHTDLTARRIAQFIKNELQERIVGDASPLIVEFCGEPHHDQKGAIAGPWQPVEAGFRYGPAYRTVWFRLRGRVPKEFANREIGLIAEVGGERTVWRENSPWRGLDEPHNVM